jgi:hypothetical protein
MSVRIIESRSKRMIAVCKDMAAAAEYWAAHSLRDVCFVSVERIEVEAIERTDRERPRRRH